MIDAPTTQERLDRIDRLERRSYWVQIAFTLALLFVIAAPFLLAWWINSNPNLIHELKASNMRVIGPSDLCPGDNLTVGFDFTGKGHGLVIEDATFYRVTPPATIITSQSQRYILAQDSQRSVTRVWRVPRTYVDEATGKTAPLEPGNYRRLYALSAPSRGAIVDVESVDFTVKEEEDCPK